MEIELCGVCGNDRSYHDRDSVLHQFSPGGQLRRKSDDPGENTSRGIKPGGDPILRLLLIRKGIISVEEIESAEKELKALGVASVGTVTRSGGEDPANRPVDTRG